MSNITAIIMPQGKGSYTLEFYSDLGDWLFCLNQDVTQSFEENFDALLADGDTFDGHNPEVIRAKCRVATRQLFPHLYTK
jgi:hypothetical protein